MPKIVTRSLRNRTSRAASLVAAATAACLLAGLTLITLAQRAESAPLRMIVLGQTTQVPKPDCPTSPRRSCKAEGHVTAFQSLAAGAAPRPFEAPFDGAIISWSITLSKPSQQQSGPVTDEIAYFNEFFGEPSQARIAVLKRVPRAKPPRFRLLRQSPVMILNPYFGGTVEFALEHPLFISEGNVVALTVPTWAPMFAHSGACDPNAVGEPRDPDRCARYSELNQWRGSRQPGKCLSAEGIQNGHPQQGVNSRRDYACYYEGARLLYTATVVKKPQR